MKKIGLFYWPLKGNVEACAQKVYKHFPGEQIELHSVNEINDVTLENFDLFIIGGSTVGADVWQKSADSNRWFDFFKKVEKANLKDKPVAIFGLGDHITYTQGFVDHIGLVGKELMKNGAALVGPVKTDGYEFDESEAIIDDMFIGLPIDEDFEPELTDERVAAWVELIKPDFGF